ncbi:MAG: polysaccharide deacetylase family protein [Armatimonadetes bacterium]|nr:polysaccharide deacetylase family protein [Armatimonadota bacterium]
MTPLASPVHRIVLVRTIQASLLAGLLHGALRWPLTGPCALGLFFTPTLCLYFVFVFVAPWTWGLPILARLPGRARAVALTFDDGPSPETTPAILDALARARVRATFFVLGEVVERHPDLLRRIVTAGHDIGIHGFGHEPFVLLSWGRVGEEITRTRAAVRGACPEAADLIWMRPPHGFKTLALPFVARRAGCRMVAWLVNARDYRSDDADTITRAVLQAARPGAIILLHDGPCNAATAAALPRILDGLRADGYRCALLD